MGTGKACWAGCRFRTLPMFCSPLLTTSEFFKEHHVTQRNLKIISGVEQGWWLQGCGHFSALLVSRVPAAEPPKAMPRSSQLHTILGFIASTMLLLGVDNIPPRFSKGPPSHTSALLLSSLSTFCLMRGRKKRL